MRSKRIATACLALLLGPLAALATETGAPIDVEHITSTLGPPLEMALAPWFGGAALDAAVIRFRELHGDLLHLTIAMPGAVAAVAAAQYVMWILNGQP